MGSIIGQTVARWLLKGIVTLVTFIPVGLFDLAERLLRFVSGPNFINVRYTTNDFVRLGWTLTRDFANMFFIIILVIIGLATALRIREYQWQKTLPFLIGIALLINFTPVILGIIIDASNIVMNFFVSGISEEGFFAPRMHALWVAVNNIIANVDWTDPGSYFAILIIPLVYFIFNIMAAIIYFLFAALFILRYVALWALVILSPIAFFCYILPATRKIFSLWWNQFIQWCVIGIAAAFILYLADNLLYIIMKGGFVVESTQEGWGIANQIIPYFIVLAFLVFGFFGALSTSAMGATAVIAVAQKGAKTAGKWTGKKAGRGIEKGLKIPEKAERLGRWAASKPFLRATAGRPLLGYAKRRKEEEKKEFEGMPFRAQAAIKRKKGESIQDSLRRVVRGYDPRKFATQAHANDIDLDVIKAMSVKQTTATRDRGSDELKEALQNGIKKNGVALQQEYLNLRAARKTEEAHRLAQKTRIIQDPNFIA